ncbi:uncharacterized protein CCR75_001934 [Bremia lactucae]|uniref:Tf2-1-like SH3-like domain-containing protein n=1 Tax=Bremia lactucae TaxID=4779 RepID=A0A976IH38_BRELC|nr:hypothetical protein CCR75_001934 [Bremia lactucae]
MAEFADNSCQHARTGMSPFMADLGYKRRAFDDITLLDRPQIPAMLFALSITKSRFSSDVVTLLLQHKQPKNTFTTAIGLMSILLDTLNLDLTQIGAKDRCMLTARFIGTYKIIQRTNPDTYHILLPPAVRLHDEFHVAYLQPYAEDTNDKRLNNMPCLIIRDGTEGNQVRAIIGQRTRHGIRQSKVRWAVTNATCGNQRSTSHKPMA